MKILYIERLCRVHFWSVNENQRLKRFMQYTHHHYELGLDHQRRTEDRQGTFLDFSPDAELGDDPFTTFASGGFWLGLSSPCGSRKWPICFGTKETGHSSGSTADSETRSLVGSKDVHLKR